MGQRVSGTASLVDLRVGAGAEEHRVGFLDDQRPHRALGAGWRGENGLAADLGGPDLGFGFVNGERLVDGADEGLFQRFAAVEPHPRRAVAVLLDHVAQNFRFVLGERSQRRQ